MPTARTVSVSNFMLTLDGVACGVLASSVGGDISADVIEVRVDGSLFVTKSIGPPKYEDFTLRFGFGLASPVYDWIAATWKADLVRKDGSVAVVDQTLNAESEQQFVNALLTKTTIPALDAASKDSGHLTIALSPESTKTVKASGKAPAVAKQKAFAVSNFRLELDGLDCTHVTKIDSFTVEVQFAADAVGEKRELRKEPARIAFPDLRVTLADGQTAVGWKAWFADFVIAGNNGAGAEKNGAIVFLAADRTTELGRVLLHNVGIAALRQVPLVSSETVRRLAAELYCERMELHIGPPAPPAPVKVDEPTPRKLPVAPGKIIGIPR